MVSSDERKGRLGPLVNKELVARARGGIVWRGRGHTGDDDGNIAESEWFHGHEQCTRTHIVVIIEFNPEQHLPVVQVLPQRALYQTVFPHETWRSTALAYLFILPEYPASRLCTSSTKAVLPAYGKFEAATPGQSTGPRRSASSPSPARSPHRTRLVRGPPGRSRYI